MDTTSFKTVDVQLRCHSWQQLASIYQQDLQRGRLFLRSAEPSDLETRFNVSMTLPSGSIVLFKGTATEHIPPGGLEGRGPGVLITVFDLSSTTVWMIESALKAANIEVTAVPHAEFAMDSSQPCDLAEDDLLRSLIDELESLKGQDAPTVLDISKDATPDECLEAFNALCTRYHPDRFARYESLRIREVASEIFLLIRDAHSEVSPPRDDSSKLATRPRRRARRVSGIDDPDKISTQARGLIDTGNYDAAVALTLLQLTRSPDDTKLRAYHDTAEGFRAMAFGKTKVAAECFDKALSAVPDLDVAQRGLTRLKRTTTAERRGFFSRVLGRK